MKTRRLASGREVEESNKQVHVITSKCPAKWACIDLETRDIWVLDGGHYRQPTKQEKREAALVMRNPR